MHLLQQIQANFKNNKNLKKTKRYGVYLLQFLLIFLILSPIIILFYYIFFFGVDVPYYDTWNNVPFIDDYLSNGLNGYSVFDSTGPYLGITSKLVTLFLVKFTNWNISYYYWIGFIFQLLTALTLVKIYDKPNNYVMNKELKYVWLIPILTALFSLRQWENILASWSVSFFAGIFFTVSSFYLLSRENNKAFIFAIISGLIGTVTFVAAILVWPIGLVQLLVTKPIKNKQYFFQTTIWIIISIISFILLIPRTTNPTSVSLITSRLMVLPQRFFLALGNSLSFENSIDSISSVTTLLTGVILSVLLVFSIIYIVKHRMLRAVSTEISVTLFGLASVIMIAVGRISLGAKQALSSRYTTYASIFLIGMILLIYKLGKSKQVFRGFLIILTILTMSSNISVNVREFNTGKYRKEFFVNWGSNVRNFRTASAALLENPHFSPQEIRQFARVLEKYQLSVFRDNSLFSPYYDKEYIINYDLWNEDLERVYGWFKDDWISKEGFARVYSNTYKDIKFTGYSPEFIPNNFIEVWLNDELIFSGDFVGGTNQTFIGKLQEGSNEILVKAQNAVSPASVGDNQDIRLLSYYLTIEW